jgi:hypothetical protein
MRHSFDLEIDRFSVHLGLMLKALTVSEAKPKLGRLLDKAGDGQAVYLRRKKQLFRIEPVTEIEPIPNRPVGYFAVEDNDPMVVLANSAPASFKPGK